MSAHPCITGTPTSAYIWNKVHCKVSIDKVAGCISKHTGSSISSDVDHPRTVTQQLFIFRHCSKYLTDGTALKRRQANDFLRETLIFKVRIHWEVLSSSSTGEHCWRREKPPFQGKDRLNLSKHGCLISQRIELWNIWKIYNTDTQRRNIVKLYHPAYMTTELKTRDIATAAAQTDTFLRWNCSFTTAPRNRDYTRYFWKMTMSQQRSCRFRFHSTSPFSPSPSEKHAGLSQWSGPRRDATGVSALSALVANKDSSLSQWEVSVACLHARNRMGQSAWDWGCGFRGICTPLGCTAGKLDFSSSNKELVCEQKLEKRSSLQGNQQSVAGWKYKGLCWITNVKLQACTYHSDPLCTDLTGS